MLRLASDENFNGEVLRGLIRRQEGLDVVRIQDAGLLEADDPAILAWAAAEGRILLTHDRMPIGQAIEQILMAVLCSAQEEWKDRVEFLPW